MVRRSLFSNYFYGKPGKSDYTREDLPKNRRELFREVLRARWGNLISVNLVYLSCWIPAILWSYINFLQLNRILSQPDAATAVAELEQLLFTWLLFMFPLVTITGPFSMGVGYVLRNWARDEHSFPFSDGKAALKANWKQGLLYGAINGLAPLLAYVCGRFYLSLAAGSVVFYLPLALTLIVAALWWLSSPILPMMIVTYQQKFFGQVRNAVIMTMTVLPRAILLRLLTSLLPIIGIFCALFAPSALRWGAPILLILYTVFLPAFNRLIWSSHANALCEKHLNSKIEGAQTDIGLNTQSGGEA